jgi:uncharacterized phage protein gp47/JayE
VATNTDTIYKSRDQIVDDILAAWEARIPGVNTGPDSIINIDAQVFAEIAEGLFLQAQLVHNDIFIQSASALALQRYGEEFGRPQLGGTLATGNVRFEGAGGTYIPAGTQVGAPRPSEDDELVYETTVAAVIPTPGIPTAPVASDGGTGGTLSGTYEYVVTFTTAEGETTAGPVSNAITVAATHKVSLASIPIGGAGTLHRRIYRRLNGGAWGLLVEILNNTTTTYLDNITTTAPTPPAQSTAERVTVAVQATDVGVEYNADIGTVVDLVGDPGSGIVSGLAGVSNVAAFTGGSDDEDIEDFRQALIEWVRAPMSGATADLVAWAETVPGVESATAFPNVNLAGAAAPGTVTVRISGPGGTVPDSSVVTAVQAELAAHDLANITILVGTFTPHTVNVTVDVTTSGTYTLADVTPSVQAAISDYINGLDVGSTVYAAGIIADVFFLPGIQNVTTTFTDTTVAATEKPVSGTITVT